jgi:hypothetical protein
MSLLYREEKYISSPHTCSNKYLFASNTTNHLQRKVQNRERIKPNPHAVWAKPHLFFQFALWIMKSSMKLTEKRGFVLYNYMGVSDNHTTLPIAAEKKEEEKEAKPLSLLLFYPHRHNENDLI